MNTDPIIVYNAIVRLGGARLDQLVNELKPISQSTVSRLIRLLVGQEMIHRSGYEWFPVLDLGSGVLDLCSGEGTQLSQVKQSGTQLSQVKQNDVRTQCFGNPTEKPNSNGFLARMEDKHLADALAHPIGGSFGSMSDDTNAALSLALRAALEEADNGIPIPINNRFTIKNDPAVMRHIVLKVRKARSRHNRGEGAKCARAKALKKYYSMKLIPRVDIEDMRYLALSISKSVAHGLWWDDEAMHVKEMDRLIPDWRCGYTKALRDLGLLDDEPDEPEDTKPVSAAMDMTPTGLVDTEDIVLSAPDPEPPTEPAPLVFVPLPPPLTPTEPIVYLAVEPDDAVVDRVWRECCAAAGCDPGLGLAVANKPVAAPPIPEAAEIPHIDQHNTGSPQWLN
jgi:hypothetical protein